MCQFLGFIVMLGLSSIASATTVDLSFTQDSDGSSADETLTVGSSRTWESVATVDGTTIDLQVELVSTDFDGTVETGISDDDLVVYLNESVTDCTGSCQDTYNAEITYTFLNHDDGSTVSIIPALTIKDIDGWTTTDGYELVSTSLDDLTGIIINYDTEIEATPDLSNQLIVLQGLAEHEQSSAEGAATLTFSSIESFTLDYTRARGTGTDISSAFYLDGNVTVDDFYDTPVTYERDDSVYGDVDIEYASSTEITVSATGATAEATVSVYVDGTEICDTAADSSGAWSCDVSDLDEGEHDVTIYAIIQSSTYIYYYGFNDSTAVYTSSSEDEETSSSSSATTETSSSSSDSSSTAGINVSVSTGGSFSYWWLLALPLLTRFRSRKHW